MAALEEVKDLAEAVARRRRLKLWDVEMAGQPGRSVVRVYIDGDDGVDLDTVAQVSDEISRGLDLKDPIAGRYTLEVSTPGLERSLKLPEHFRSSVGDAVVIKTVERLVDGSHRLEGTIRSADERGIHVTLAGGKAGEEIEVPYDAIKSARTVFEWK